MQKFLKFSMFVAIVAIAIVGCKKDPKPDDSGNDGVMQPIALEGKVMNTNGEPISGVQVTSGTAKATTDADGDFRFTEAQVVDKRAVIKFEKSGYFPLTRSGIKEKEMYLEVVLVAKGNSDITLQEEFEAPKGATLKIGGMKVALPASAIKTANGSDYNGTVKTDMIYLDPNNKNFSDMMPGGDLAGIRTGGNEEMLISYGMTNVSLTDDKGNPLQLKGDVPAEVTFPVPAGMEKDAPATMPLWHFDEQKGIWIEDGVATLQGGVYVGTVTHFSWVNCDYPEDVVTIKGLVVDCRDEPVAKIKVFSGQTSITTNGKGEYSGAVPANTPVTITVEWLGVSYSISLPGYPGGTTQTAPPIKIPCGVIIKGKVLCENQDPVTGVKVTAGQVSAYTNSKGEYSFRVAPNIPVTVKVTANGKNDSEEVPAQPEGTVYTVRNFVVPCEGGDEPGTYTTVEKGAVKYVVNENEDMLFAITFDNNGMRYRYDTFSVEEDTKSHLAIIINHFTQTYWYGFGSDGQWNDLEYDWSYTGSPFTMDEVAMAPYLQSEKVNIAGKTCNVYKFAYEDKEYIYAVWNGLLMFIEMDGQEFMRAVAATLNVPEVAFTKTFDVTWF